MQGFNPPIEEGGYYITYSILYMTLQLHTEGIDTYLVKCYFLSILTLAFNLIFYKTFPSVVNTILLSLYKSASFHIYLSITAFTVSCGICANAKPQSLVGKLRANTNILTRRDLQSAKQSVSTPTSYLLPLVHCFRLVPK